MAGTKVPDGNIERLAHAVADRFSASAHAARLSGTASTLASSPTLVDRLASAVGQRLAARAGGDIDKLASAIAHHLAASTGAARLASAAARHFAGELVWSDPELDRLVTEAAVQLKTT